MSALRRFCLFIFLLLALLSLGCGSQGRAADNKAPAAPAAGQAASAQDLILVKGGSFAMGSPASEAWRGQDEVQHQVRVSDFYLSPYEVSQEEYQALMGKNPSNFKSAKLPVENISWLDALAYCNARSSKEGLTPAYEISANNVKWNRAADGYRLPTEAEWEYACRAGTTTPFNTENSISPQEADYYGHYPYQIEENYFTQEKLTTQPGVYRETTVAVNSFAPNKWGFYNMHGNVNEWVWDYYGTYPQQPGQDPAGPLSGTLRVYRGGGWNDFAKNLRSAYRAALPQDKASFNLGLRVARNAAALSGSLAVSVATPAKGAKGKVLVAYFSWGGTTRGIANQIQMQSGADSFEIVPQQPYSTSYHQVLEEAQRDQNRQARPALAGKVANMEQYSVILLGYPNWWASIPMPIASFLESYDFRGKTIIPFCSHGGGRFGQSLTAIAKLAPQAQLGEPLSVHYGGGSDLPQVIDRWLAANGLAK